MAIFCQASGFKALERKLQALKTLTTNPRIDKALGQGTTKMQAQIKLLTPVDTGNLRDKIVWNHVKMMEYTIETNVEYAFFVEFGTGMLGDPAVPFDAGTDRVYAKMSMVIYKLGRYRNIREATVASPDEKVRLFHLLQEKTEATDRQIAKFLHMT